MSQKQNCLFVLFVYCNIHTWGGGDLEPATAGHHTGLHANRAKPPMRMRRIGSIIRLFTSFLVWDRLYTHSCLLAVVYVLRSQRNPYLT